MKTIGEYSFDLKHQTGLSSIIEYGEELGERPW